MKYYIIKDLNTGLYYRGKGQNRWGKYYNQASIFRNLAQANNSAEYLKLYDKSNAVVVEISIVEGKETILYLEDLVHRDSPNRPARKLGNWGDCPECNKQVFNGWDNCPYCGQKLDWNE